MSLRSVAERIVCYWFPFGNPPAIRLIESALGNVSPRSIAMASFGTESARRYTGERGHKYVVAAWIRLPQKLTRLTRRRLQRRFYSCYRPREDERNNCEP